MVRKKKQFCIHGHDTFECGRDNKGNCLMCRTIGRRVDPTKNSRFKRFCPKGHDKDLVGRNKDGKCKNCMHERNAKKHREIQEGTRVVKHRQFCGRGHNTLITGRKINGNCSVCSQMTTNKRHKVIYDTDIQMKLKILLRTRINRALKGKLKPSSAVERLGCSIPFLISYLQSKFLPGMTLENHGFGQDKWHIDHILPLDSFDLTDPIQFAMACHYTNLQPMWQSDNLRKSNKIL